MPSSVFNRLAIAAVLSAIGTPAGAAPQSQPATSDVRSANAGPAIFRYQLALDQLAQGDVTSARVLAEAARKSYGDSPEINMLLAYLLQKEGRTSEAKAALEIVRNTSPLAAAQSSQLVSAAPPSPALPAVKPAAAPAAKSVASLPQKDARLVTLEAYMVGKVNEERRKAGLVALTTDGTLANTARAHSAEMRDLKYFAHESPTPDLRDASDRYFAVFGETPSIVAENIYSAWGSPHQLNQRDIDTGHQKLMNSPGHKANILEKDVRRIGIGIVTNANGDLWVTQMFARD